MWGCSSPQKLRPPRRPFSFCFGLCQQLRQLGDIGRYPPRLVQLDSNQSSDLPTVLQMAQQVCTYGFTEQ
jgi:hypothetical protein